MAPLRRSLCRAYAPWAIPWRNFMRFRLQALAAGEPDRARNARRISNQALDAALRFCRYRDSEPRHCCAERGSAAPDGRRGARHRALPASMAPPRPEIVARPLADPAARRDIVLAAVAGRQQGLALAAFLKLMRARDWRRRTGGIEIITGRYWRSIATAAMLIRQCSPTGRVQRVEKRNSECRWKRN